MVDILFQKTIYIVIVNNYINSNRIYKKVNTTLLKNGINMTRIKLFNGPFSTIDCTKWTDLVLNGPVVNLFYVMNKKINYAL